MQAEALRGHIDTMVLATLRRGPAHGYALVRELAEQSAGTFTLGEGTLYPSLHRLEHDGLVASELDEARRPAPARLPADERR